MNDPNRFVDYVVETLIVLFLQFKALQIPEPVDTQTSNINAQEAEAVSGSFRDLGLVEHKHLYLSSI